MKVKIKDPTKYDLDDWLKVYSNEGVINVVVYDLPEVSIYEWRTPEGLYVFKRDELIFMEENNMEEYLIKEAQATLDRTNPHKRQKEALLKLCDKMSSDYGHLSKICATLAEIYDLASEYPHLIEIKLKVTK